LGSGAGEFIARGLLNVINLGDERFYGNFALLGRQSSIIVSQRVELIRINPCLSQDASNGSGGNLAMFRNNCGARTGGCYLDELNVTAGLSRQGNPAASSLRFTSRNGGGFMRP
jgi:hypothetical protein